MFHFVMTAFLGRIQALRAGGKVLGAARVSLRSLALVLVPVLLVSCTPAPPSSQSPVGFQDARSQSCAATRGVSALYWDFMNGVIRVDYPETLRLPPFPPGAVFIHPTQPLYSFSYPPSWGTETLVDGPSNLAGVNVVRADGQAVWRRLSFVASGVVTARDYLDVEIRQMLDILGITQPVETICFVEFGDGAAATLIRAGGFTANVSAQVFVNPFLGGFVSNIFAQLVVAPSADYEATAFNVFFPLSGQMNLGGGSDPECSDRIDNDGDGKTDFPEDPGCSSASDPSEAG